MQKIHEAVELPDPQDGYLQDRLRNRDQWRVLVQEFEDKKSGVYPFNPLAGDTEGLGETELLRRALLQFNASIPVQAKCMCTEFAG